MRDYNRPYDREGGPVDHEGRQIIVCRFHGGYPTDGRTRGVDPDRDARAAPADDAPADARVCVVAARPDTFERCREGVYPAPASYARAREPFEYVAFYRTAPTSAVTHYARSGPGPTSAGARTAPSRRPTERPPSNPSPIPTR